jgi:hypothetical protein
MCISPSRLDDGTEVACRNCRLCRANRINDLVGRCIAEDSTSKATYAVTLTYADTAGVNAVTLVYKDVQRMLYRLRKRYKVRYICAGEYGTKKGRAHWHIILFFKDKDPKIERDVRVNWKYWEHGFSYFQQPDWKGFQYVLKYVLKDQDTDSHDSHLAMSKKPPLGHEWFMDLAKTHVEQAVIPRSFKYKIGGIRKDNGQEKVFMMQGKTRENFMNAFKEGWIQKYGKEPTSEFYEEWDEANYKNEAQPIAWNEIELNGRKIANPVFDEEKTISRIHHKDVIYYEPWVQMGSDEDRGTWTEVEYQGIDLVLHEQGEEAWIYTQDGQQWQEKRKAVIDQIKKGQTKRRRTFDEAQREELEELVKLNEKRSRKIGQYQQRTL